MYNNFRNSDILWIFPSDFFWYLQTPGNNVPYVFWIILHFSIWYHKADNLRNTIKIAKKVPFIKLVDHSILSNLQVKRMHCPLKFRILLLYSVILWDLHISFQNNWPYNFFMITIKGFDMIMVECVRKPGRHHWVNIIANPFFKLWGTSR